MQCLFFLWMVCYFSSLQAQEPEWEDRFSAQEGLVERAAQESEATALRLGIFLRKPLDLNQATAAEIEELGLLMPWQIEAWIRFRERFGGAKSWYEFQSVPGWSASTVAVIRPYCRLGTVAGMGSRAFSGSWQQQWLCRLAWSSQALPAEVGGGQWDRLIRYDLTAEAGLRAGFSMENDAGERVGRKGPDFWSAFVKWQRPGRRTTWLLGDYSVQMGQGLIAWQGMVFGAGGDPGAIRRQGLMVRPYQSVGESRFMRGLAFSGGFSGWDWDAFVSRNRQSATLYELPDGQLGFRAVDVSGFHRTRSEERKKDALIEYTAGGRLGRAFSGGRMHFNWIGRNWSLPRFRAGDLYEADTQWMRGKLNMSVDGSYTKDNLHFFGELALDAKGAFSGVAGLVAVLHRRVDLSVHLRSVQRAFESVEGQVFQQMFSGRSERGFYGQFRLRLDDRQLVDLYTDQSVCPFTGPGLLPHTAARIQGWRWQYQADKRTGFSLRFQSVRRDRETSGGAGLMASEGIEIHRSVRVQGQVALGNSGTVGWRGERVSVLLPGSIREQGFLTYLEWTRENVFPKMNLDMNLRLQWVSTDGWASRIYAYERDVLYKVGFPAFQGQRLRGYLNMAGSLGKQTRIWVRFFIDKVFENQPIEPNFNPIVSGVTLQLRHQLGKASR